MKNGGDAAGRVHGGYGIDIQSLVWVRELTGKSCELLRDHVSRGDSKKIWIGLVS